MTVLGFIRTLGGLAGAAALAMGLSLGGATPAHSEDAAANTLILQIGLGYDSPSDTSPASTEQVVIELVPEFAPNHAERLKSLTRDGWYNGKLFHRVIEGFMAQTGSPNGDGVGGAEGRANLQAEFSNVKFERGVVGMARTRDRDGANSQFFIMFDRAAPLDGLYTVVGRVTQGMDVVDRLTRTHKSTRRGELPLGVTPDRIISARVAADG
ncbi:MAG: peptidylprolyl isomerase [Pseudomonadota bacterium]